jgi:hypothetical protein
VAHVAFTLTHPALVTRVGAGELRALAAPLWADKDIVDPEGT